MQEPKLILASGSAYRAQLLARLGIEFEQIRADTDETQKLPETPPALAQRLAYAKARAVANAHPSALVIGSDQVAELDDQALGKPGSATVAHAQLTRCSGRMVSFHTALCVVDSKGNPHTAIDLTRVYFRQLHAEEITRYIDTEQPLDCAGSFKCEGLGIALFERIESTDPTALIGMPMIALTRLLRNCGLAIP